MFIEYDNNDENTIGMTEGDYGIILPIELNLNPDTQLEPSDKFAIKIFKKINGSPIITKVYENIVNNTIEFQLNQEDTKLLKPGNYYYDIDWFQEERFLNNIQAKGLFEVLEKAGTNYENKN
jgi:hypothetical protein